MNARTSRTSRTCRSWSTWRDAWTQAVYGPTGFARRERPVTHFRTSPHVSPLFAAALLRLADGVGAREVVDVGAGGGELLAALHALAGERLMLTGVDVAPRPGGLPPDVGWLGRLDDLPPVDGLLVANEWLDDVPIDVVVGGRLVEVSPDGTERLGDAAPAADLEWIARWWRGGDRAEVGRSRDETWAAAVRRVRRGVAIAIDYAVPTPAPAGGTLAGYRAGREVPPTPDGVTNLTAHVLLDACAAAGTAAGAVTAGTLPQRSALRALGVTGSRPGRGLAGSDPAGYARALQRAGEAAELIDAAGLGGLSWLIQSVGFDDLAGTR